MILTQEIKNELRKAYFEIDEDIEILTKEKRYTKNKALSHIGRISFMVEFGIIDADEAIEKLKKIQRIANLSEIEVDEAMFFA